MRTDDLDYELPRALIAQHPLEPRDRARLLVDRGEGTDPHDATVAQLPELLAPGDMVVLNDTRVLPARVPIERPSGADGEVLLLEDRGDGWWEALCRPSKRLRAGSAVQSVHGHIAFEMGEDLGGGRRLVHPEVVGAPGPGPEQLTLMDALQLDGEMPLPPYITEALEDPERYQTTYARRPASVAAPTAGLHLTKELLGNLQAAGITVRSVELVVGLDTFRPLSTELVEDHRIHTEYYRVTEQSWTDINSVRAAGGRVVAVGTTTVRALESVAHRGQLSGRTALFITPGFHFSVIDVLLTNFHLPRSSLLALLAAFTGPRWRDLYSVAMDRGYRFLSFGDAMLLGATPQPRARPR